ncbi:MAG: beta-lactamase family protein [Chloroflexota bacterium]|nr:beta-lactamase family protein [Chloroflexota bacterium]
MAGDHAIHGWCDERFLAVRDAFAEVHLGRAGEREIGSMVAVYQGDDLVVDLWGGFRDASSTRPWERDTIVLMMSVAKGISAMCTHMLIDRGVIEPDAPVARYWPEFAQNGKENVLVRHVLDHTAGLCYAENVPPGAVFEHSVMAEALARQEPAWRPGTRSGYHMLTQGFLLNEIFRRSDGRTLGTFLREELAGPLGADYAIGLGVSDLVRCAEFIPAVAGILDRDHMDPSTFLARAWNGSPEGTDFSYYNSTRWRTVEIPSANGHGTSRGVARMYAAFASGGRLGGVRVISEAAVDRAIEESHNYVEVVMGRSYHQALGFLLDSPPIVTYGGRPHAFGHHGVGGSLGFGDRDTGIGFAYAPNRLHERIENGPRARMLIDALWSCV